MKNILPATHVVCTLGVFELNLVLITLATKSGVGMFVF